MGISKRRQMVLSLFVGSDCTLEEALVRSGYSEKSAVITACELRRSPEYLAALERKQTQKLEKLERGKLSDEEIVNAIRDIDLECKAQGPTANFLALRLKCNELLAKIHGMFSERLTISGVSELAQILADARQRATDLSPPAAIEGNGRFSESTVIESDFAAEGKLKPMSKDVN